MCKVTNLERACRHLCGILEYGLANLTYFCSRIPDHNVDISSQPRFSLTACGRAPPAQTHNGMHSGQSSPSSLEIPYHHSCQLLPAPPHHHHHQHMSSLHHMHILPSARCRFGQLCPSVLPICSAEFVATS